MNDKNEIILDEKNENILNEKNPTWSVINGYLDELFTIILSKKVSSNSA